MADEPLPYATGACRQPKQLRLFLLFTGLALVALIAVITRWPSRGPTIGTTKAGALQKLLLGFSLPPEFVVYDEDPVRAARLLSLPHDPSTAFPEGPASDSPDSKDVPTGDYRRGRVGGVGVYAEYIPRFHQLAFAPILAHGLVFAHERIGPSGNHRLVMVTQIPSCVDPAASRPSGLNVRLGIEIVAGSSPANQTFQVRHGSVKRRIVVPVRGGRIARLYAGQVDPNNAARFTIRYEIDDAPGTIEGVLQADDSVALRVLDGPAANSWKPLP